MEMNRTQLVSRMLVFGFQVTDGYLTQVGTQHMTGLREVAPIASNLLENQETFLVFKFLIAPLLVIVAGKIANDLIVRQKDKNFDLLTERIVNILWVLVIVNNAVYIVQAQRM